MTSYLATVAGRDLGEAASGGLTKRIAPGNIAPRLATAHEPWTITSVEQPIPNRDSYPDRTGETADPDVELVQPRVANQADNNAIAADQPTAPSINIERAVASMKPDEALRGKGREDVSIRIEPVIKARQNVSPQEPSASTPPEHPQLYDGAGLADPRYEPPGNDAERLRPDQFSQSERPTVSKIAVPHVREVVTVVPRRAELRADLNHARGIAPTSSPEPTVIVTIGRIEVRAATTTQPTLNPARGENRAMMSLDDYLHQRVRGAR